jgi:hypothetical protein
VATDGGACSQCGSYSFQSATWVEGRGTVCAKCLPPRKRHRHDEDEDDGVVQPVVALSVSLGNGQARRLSRDEAVAAYGAGKVSERYGEAG